MSVTLIVIGICLCFGAVAAIAARGPFSFEVRPRAFTRDDLKRFSPQKTLFIIGPSADHSACRLQRRLLKPAIALIIREDLSVIELYGDEQPLKNGDEIDWLDPDLMRHAMGVSSGFHVVYFDQEGRKTFTSNAPIVSNDLFDKIGLMPRSETSTPETSSRVLSKLRAA
ncbi:MAG: hypothetical protein AAF720_02315 [Pseudomonadota bacterium]